MKLAIFASGRGSNFAAILKAVKKGKVAATVELLVCDTPSAAVIQKAQKGGVKVALVERQRFASTAEFEAAIIRQLQEAGIELIVLAGFMRMLGPSLIQRYRGRIINIHPALLPAFKGAAGIHDAFFYGVKVTGVTVHFVDEEMDHGPIILQQAVVVRPTDTLESLEARIHATEHRLYPQAIQLLVKNKLRIEGRQVRIC